MWCVPEFLRDGQGKMSMESEKSRKLPEIPKEENVELQLQDYQLELENRIRNLLWTISGDYTQQMKPDVSLFLRSKDIALYDGIKQGALAKFFDKDFLGMYLVKKIFLGADEASLTFVSQMCIEEAIGERICQLRPGIWEMQKKACEDILDQEYDTLPPASDKLGYLRVNMLQRRISRRDKRKQIRETYAEEEKKRQQKKGIYYYIDLVSGAACAEDTMSLIRIIDTVYNEVADPDFAGKATLEQVLAVTLEDLTEFDWKDYLSEEMYEDALESYMEQLTSNVAGMEDRAVTQEMEEERQKKHKIKVLPPEALEKAHTYVELNFGKTYLTENEEKRMNQLMCRDIHSDCSLYFTEGILKNPVKRNYQYEYAKRLKNKNIWLYHDKHRIVNKSESQEILSDRGIIVPSRLWRLGRSSEARVFKREIKGDNSDFVVDVLIDASGSQMSRQGEVALQAYIISEALSNVGLPYRVMSYCTFWDYTILHRFREYDDPRSANENIFNYVTSSNNRDGLAIRAAGYGLLMREEEKKILIVLSDGRPYDVIVNRPNAKNPAPYHGKYAITDTAAQIRRLRSQGVSVLGIFAGEEKDLQAEKKIFGKDFAYIRDITGFSRIAGRYLVKQLEEEE